MIPTAALILGGLWFLYDGLNTNNVWKTVAGCFVIAIGAWLQFHYINKRYPS
jgi:hypothetical protein